jgi:DNA gyrase subunit A
VIQRRSQYELERRKARLHIVQGLLIALDQIDEVIDTIRRSRTADTARRNLMRKFKLTEIQATAILDMQLRRLAAMERSKLKKEEKELQKRIRELEALLASEAKQLKVVRDETAEVKERYATPRRTTIVDAAPGEKGAAVTSADLAVPDAPQMVVVTTTGVERCDSQDYSYRVRSGATSRAVTAHRMRVRAEPTDRICLVSSTGRAWIAPVGQVPEESTRSKMRLGREEHIVHLGKVDQDQYLVLGTARGKVKRVAFSVLAGQLLDGMWTEVIGLAKADRVVFASACGPKGEVLLFSNSHVLRTSAAEVSDQKTLSARGVAGIKLNKGQDLLGGAVLATTQRCEVFALSEKGYLKRTPLELFALQGRGGKGVQALKITQATGPIVAAMAGRVIQATKVDVLAQDGKRQRVPLKSIPRVRTRQSCGKKLVTIDQASEIVLW